MRHRIAGFKLGRDTEHRKAMRRNMAIALFTHGQITTTVPKAKSVRPFVEKLITTARKGDLASRRRVLQQLGNPFMVQAEDAEGLRRSKSRANRVGGFVGKLVGGPKLVKHLFEEIAPRYADRPGGYTRIVRLTKHRIGDGSDLCVLQLVGDEQGAQVAGQYSRRRDKANRRTAFAAQKRKAATEPQAATTEDVAAEESPEDSQTPEAAGE